MSLRLAQNILISSALLFSFRCLSAGNTSYVYDAENHRISINPNNDLTSFVINPGANISETLMKTDSYGNKTYYVYGLGLIGEEDSDGTYKTYHFDRRGSTTALTDINGKVLDRYEYAPYGELTNHTGSSDTPFLFNGRDGVMTDSNGLYYMRSRYYNPEIKRFINSDVVQGSINEGQTLNRYAYVNGNPISYVDPFGTSRDEDQYAPFRWVSAIPVFGWGWTLGEGLCKAIAEPDKYHDWAEWQSRMLGSTINTVLFLVPLGSVFTGAETMSELYWFALYGAPTSTMMAVNSAHNAEEENMQGRIQTGKDGNGTYTNGEGKPSYENVSPYSTSKWSEYLNNKYGAENVSYKARNFTSTDPLVGELATDIDARFPGRVQDINVIRRDPKTGRVLTDLDIELEDVVIQVKDGGGNGMLKQLKLSKELTNKTAIGYGPDIKGSIVKSANSEGFTIFRSQDELMKYLNSLK